jgi:hypothetical protein
MKYKGIRNNFWFWFGWMFIIVNLISEVFSYLARRVTENSLWSIIFSIFAILPFLSPAIVYALICWRKDSSGNYMIDASTRRASLIALVVAIISVVFIIAYGSIEIL